MNCVRPYKLIKIWLHIRSWNLDFTIFFRRKFSESFSWPICEKQCFSFVEKSEFIISVFVYSYSWQQIILTGFSNSNILPKYRTCFRFISKWYFHNINSKTNIYLYEKDFYRLSANCTWHLYCYTTDLYFAMASFTWEIVEIFVFSKNWRYAHLKIKYVCFPNLYSNYRVLNTMFGRTL